MNAKNIVLTAGLLTLASAALGAPTTGLGSASPNPVNAGRVVVTSVAVSPGGIDFAAPFTVLEEMISLGAETKSVMYDDGTHGDLQEGDNIYTLEYTVPANVKPGVYEIPFEVLSAGELVFAGSYKLAVGAPACSADFDGDTDVATDADIEAFFNCLSGRCCLSCGSMDFNGDGDYATDADIESFFSVLAGGPC